MKILAELEKQRNFAAKEIERAKHRIDTLRHEIDQLYVCIEREEEKVSQYDVVLSHCQSLKEDSHG
jgi:chromosome segregation ATPase